MRKVYSHTKRSVLEKCPRMYFSQYYAATCKSPVRNPQRSLFGDDGPEHRTLIAAESATAGRLAKLNSAPQHAGKILHDLIALALKHPDWQSAWFEKKARVRFHASPETEVLFVERFNNLPDADKRIQCALDGLLKGLRAFFEDKQMRMLVESMRYGETQLIEHPISGFRPVRQFSIQGRIDYCAKIWPSGGSCRLENGTIHWRRGEPATCGLRHLGRTALWGRA